MNDRKVKLGHRLQSCLKIGQQIRLTTPSLGKITPASQAQLPQVRIADSNSTNAVSFSSACIVSIRPLRDQTNRERMNRTLQFDKHGQLFIGTHDEPLSVAVSVNNPDCSSFGING